MATGSLPHGWGWSALDASRPRRGIEHLTQSDVTPMYVDCLRPSDTPPHSKWALTRDFPIIIMDTLDTYWAFDRVLNKLHSFARTREKAKAELVSKLGGHLQLLVSLESPKMAPILRLEIEFLRAVMRPVEPPGP